MQLLKDKTQLLHDHLSCDVLPSAGVEVKEPEFGIICLAAPQGVYLFQEKKTHRCFVGKFFGHRTHLSKKEQQDCLNREYENLYMIREKGFSSIPERVVQPLSKNEEIDCLLVEDFIRGHDLDYYICKASFQGQHERLLRKLTKLAYFLFKLHDGTSMTVQVNFDEVISYFRLIIDTLERDGIISSQSAQEFYPMFEAWKKSKDMWPDQTVFVHGDATPTNFFFHPEDGVTAIDLERLQPADRVYDIGFLAAELKHHFAWRLLQAGAAEPFISHLYRTYCECLTDSEESFHEITRRSRFYMALGEVRIARNPWLPLKHRIWLVEDALRCLTQ